MHNLHHAPLNILNRILVIPLDGVWKSGGI